MGRNRKKAIVEIKIKNKIWAIPEIKNHKIIHSLTLTRPQTQHKKPEHEYLIF